VVKILGFSGHLDPGERVTANQLCQFLQQFADDPKVVFVYNRDEVQLHGMRYHARSNEVRLLLKSVGNRF
jgi:hypothetical protein